LGDLGVQGMGMAVGKTTLFTALGGLDPADVLPICIDVGTDNEDLLKDKFYIGLRQKRQNGDEYYDLLDEVVYGLKRRFGPRVFMCFEEFSNKNAKALVDKYNSNSLAFCDDLQGIAATTLASIISALPQMGGSLRDQRFLFAGAGETGAHCAELLATYICQEHGITLPEARKNIYFIDRRGLVTRSRAEVEDDMELHKLPYAHDIKECGASVLDAVKMVKPTALIGVRRHRFSFFEGSVLKDEKLFNTDVLRAMAEHSERPLIMALSRPSALHECTAQEAYNATDGKCIFVSGCHSPPFEYNGKRIAPSECTTEYVYPGFALGLAMAEATHVRDSLLIAAAEAVADQTTDEDIAHGAVFPRKRDIPNISSHVAARVASEAFAQGLSALPNKPMDWLRLAKSWKFDPTYRPYTG
jgi:malate dehydrogenase (oxaloacetate-decarboxylating)(NADP+)